LQFKNKFIVLFVVVFGALSFHIGLYRPTLFAPSFLLSTKSAFSFSSSVTFSAFWFRENVGRGEVYFFHLNIGGKRRKPLYLPVKSNTMNTCMLNSDTKYNNTTKDKMTVV